MDQGSGGSSVVEGSGSIGQGSGVNGVGDGGGSFHNRFDDGGVDHGAGGGEDGRGKGSGGQGSGGKGSGGQGSGSQGGVGSSVEDQLGISLGLTLVEAVDSLVAGAGEGTGIAGGQVGPVKSGETSIVQQRVGFRTCRREGSEGENSGQVLHDMT